MEIVATESLSARDLTVLGLQEGEFRAKWMKSKNPESEAVRRERVEDLD